MKYSIVISKYILQDQQGCMEIDQLGQVEINRLYLKLQKFQLQSHYFTAYNILICVGKFFPCYDFKKMKNEQCLAICNAI